MVWPFGPSASFQAIVTAKRAQRDDGIKAQMVGLQADDHLTAEEVAIVSKSGLEIVKSIQNREFTSTQVLKAFIKSAVIAHKETNCITEVLFADGLERAKELDDYFASTGKLKGPLHGVPISLKDSNDVKGYDTTNGSTGRTNKPSARDSDLVTFIREAGGIPFVKTNVPQTLLSFECANPIWGVSSNPYNANHTPGGSSGGEAAILAMDGAALGWGSDVGGSLRIPAHYCGIYSLKPGHGRIATSNNSTIDPGFKNVPVVYGPMGRGVEDLEAAARAVIGRRRSDKFYFPAPIPYRDVQLPKKLKFGYYLMDGLVKASPVCKRAVLETVEALRKEGHECVEFDVPSPPRCTEIFAALTSSDGYQNSRREIGSDPVEPAMFLTLLGPRIWGWVRWCSVWALKNIAGDDLLARLIASSRYKDVHEFKQWEAHKDAYIREFYEKVWEVYGFDGIISATQPIPAIPHGACRFLSMLANSTILYNIVDSPVGLIPVTRVDPKLDALTEEWTLRGEGKGQGSSQVEARLYGTGGIYDAEAMAGLPVGVQIVGKSWEEEKVIEMMKVVDKALGERGFGPGSYRKWKEGRSS